MSIIYGKLPISLFNIKLNENKLSFTAIKVYIYLSSFKANKIYPTQKTIAYMIGCKHFMSAQKSIQELEKFNLLKTIKSQFRRNNMYEILYEGKKNYALINIELLKILSFTELKTLAVLLSRERLSNVLDKNYLSTILKIRINHIGTQLKSLQEKGLLYILDNDGKLTYKTLSYSKKETNLLFNDQNIFYVDFTKKLLENWYLCIILVLTSKLRDSRREPVAKSISYF